MKKKLVVLFLLLGAVELSAQTVLQKFTAVSSGAGTISDMDLPDPTAKGSVLIAMPLLLTPNVKVISVTDNAPAGGNTYKQISGTVSSCQKQSLDIWYCENCNPGVTELKFHLSEHVRASLNGFMEVSGLALSSVVDGSGAHVSDGKRTSAGLEVGPSITTTAKDFIITRYFSTPPLPTAVTPSAWTYNASFAYIPSAAAGTYQPTLSGGGGTSGTFCMSMAAFKAAPDAPPQSPQSPQAPPSPQ
jgi:hypothetical protein